MKTFINAIGTANPQHKISQQEGYHFVSSFLQLSEEEKNRVHLLYRASGIDSRYSVLEDYKRESGNFSFYSNDENCETVPTVAKRMEVFKETALPICVAAIEDCLKKVPRIKTDDITHLITVSCTGMYAPGLDIELIDELGFKTSIQRTAVNFMGCYGAFNAIKVADAICKSDAGAKVMIVCVELCTLHFLRSKDEDHILSSALFGDGAAAVLLTAKPMTEQALCLESFFCDILREGKDDMAWHISDFGFQMKLSSYVPDLIKSGIRVLTDKLLQHIDLEVEDVHFYAIHPGGKRILQVIENELNFSKEKNKWAYEVLKNYGNMSSPTVLFVLKALMDDLRPEDMGKNILSFAFGPGLTLEAMLLKVN